MIALLLDEVKSNKSRGVCEVCGGKNRWKHNTVCSTRYRTRHFFNNSILQRAADQKYLESFEMWCWRRMEKISWTDHV